MQATLPENEAARLQILRDYRILDTPMEAEFDDFTLLAAQICGTPIALISLIDEERQWFKSRRGLDVPETCRDVSFCAHALRHTEVFLIPDAQKDPRFYDNPLVTGEPFVRFYAGAPLLTAGGHALGTLCVIDQEPRTLTLAQQNALQALARQVMTRLELRRGIAARARTERKLRESEALKAAVLHTALDSIITINAGGQVVEWNPAAETTFGYPAAQAMGRDLTDLIIPAAYQDAHRRGMAHYLATGDGPVLGQRIEITALRADGAEFPVELAIVPIGLASGPLFTATLRDISARKEAELTLRQAHDEMEARVEARTRELAGLHRHTEQRFKRIAANVPGMIFQFVMQPSGSIQFPYVSDGCQAIYGVAPEEIVADPALLMDIIHPEDRQPFEDSIHAILVNASFWQWEGRVVTRNGRTVWVQGVSRAARQTDGSILGEGLILDITARKQEQAALVEAHEALARESAERQNIMETVPDILFRLDLSGRLIGWNRRMETVTGLSLEQLQDRDPLLLFVPADRDAIHAAILQAFGTGYAEVDANLLVVGGESIPYQFSGSPMKDAEGKIIGLTGIGRDMTARKVAKARIQSLNDELIQAYDATIEGWSRALDLRDHETEGHSRRVTEMTLRLAEALGVSDAERVHIRRGALLHDIGKMAVPDGVLLKPGPLNDEEWAVMRQHPVWAYEMLLPIEFLRSALEIPYCHHEKWDGSGYPRGLAGEEIPLAARLFALVDVWDALSSDRPYRRAWEPGRVLDHLQNLAGTHFDPCIVEAFLRLMEPVETRRPLARAA